MSGRDSRPTGGPPGWSASRPISIWQPRLASGALTFVRPAPLPLGDHYAAVTELAPKRGELPLRVVLLGESVAAGYLYAPHFTPAQALAAYLREVGGEGAFEVVDLARTNETLAGLRETALAAVQIQPDMLVLFAGNNWNLLETPEISPHAPAAAARRRYGEALRQGGLAGPLGAAAAALERAAQGTLDAIATIAGAIGIPVVVVVPEVNLADWENRQPVHRLPGDGTAAWYRAWRRASAHLGAPGRPARSTLPAPAVPPIPRGALGPREGEPAVTPPGRPEDAEASEVEREARAMQELDGGANPTPWRLLAWAAERRGDLSGARRLAEAEVDATAYPTLAFLAAPQATSGVRGLLRGAARRPGFSCIDLPAVFAAHTGSPLPGRGLFLDYCHLTREGIEVAMAAVAARVIELSGMLPGFSGESSWRRLAGSPPLPRRPEVEALACFGAAIHGAHRLLGVGPKTPLLEHWCERALAASAGIAGVMLDLAEMRAAACPAVLTSAQRRNFASPYRLLLQHGLRYEHLDADLLRAITRVLERHGHPAPATVTRLLLAHQAVGRRGADLLRPAGLWEPLERFYPEVMGHPDLPRHATLRSPWPEASFCLICDSASDVALEIAARLPSLEEIRPQAPGEAGGSAGPRTVAVSVNGRQVATFPAGGTWSKADLLIPSHLLARGLNRLTLHWPLPPPAGPEPLAAAAARLERGLPATLHPVFGELASLVAREV